MTDTADSQEQSRRAWIPYGILTGALVLTVLATTFASQLFHGRDQMQFDNAVEQTVEAVERRLHIYTEMLVLGSALYGSSLEVTSTEFQDYVESLQVNERYPGIQGIGFSLRVPFEEKDTLVAKMRKEGYSDFTIRPDEPPDKECHAIIYLRPLDWRNRRALGYNMFSDPVRQAAMIRARDTAAPAASGMVVLVQEAGADQQPGFLIYVPVYRGGKTPETVEERRRELVGFVYAPFRSGDLFRGIFGPKKKPSVEFSVYDGPAVRGARLLYQTDHAADPARKPWFHPPPKSLMIAGHEWTFDVVSGEKLESASGAIVVPFLGLGGLGISLLLFRLASAQARAYAAAERNARELRRSQLALRHSEDRLRLALESADLGTWELNPMDRRTRWSPRAASLFGLAADTEIPYERFLACIYGDDRSSLQRQLAQALDPHGNGQFESEFRSIASDGVHWVSARGRVFFEEKPPGRAPYRAAGTILDITRRKRVEEWTQFLAEAGQVLSESLEYERVLASLARLATPRVADYCAIDLVDSSGRLERLEVAHANPARFGAARVLLSQFSDDARGFGIAAVMRRGRPELYLRHPNDWRITAAMDQEEIRLLRSLGDVSALVVPIRTRERVLGAFTFVYAESGRTYSSEDLPLAEGLAVRAGLAVDNALLYRAAQHEIVDRKRAEEEVQRLNQNLEQRVNRRTAALQEINEQLEAFTYTVAHDLRAPLRAMQGFSQALLEDFAEQLGNTGSDYANRVIAAAQRMDALIQDLLAYSRLSRSQFAVEPVPVDAVLERVVANLQAEFRTKGAQLDVARPLPVVRAHPSTLELVLTNLLSNALKFVALGVQPHVRVWAAIHDGRARICIQDNGIGIAPDHHERIFRVFERLHGADSFPGTGIGLSIVKKGVERMGGSVGVDSTAGKGSQFWLDLPLAS